MKKAVITNPPAGEHYALSEYGVEIHHKDGSVKELSCNQYSYEGVFEYITEQYENNTDSVQEIKIKLVR